ncbi:MAG: DUF58 domain-containing protein [Desulfovibrionaceae bacterium]|nr:MAG: DUF58 domain-containing protein [Desulfovibrionaceae bacterium]
MKSDDPVGRRPLRGSVRPTVRAAACFALSVPAALLLIAGRPEWWYVSLYWPAAVLALSAADMLMVLPGRRLGLEVQTPGRLSVGQSGGVRLSLKAEGRTPPAAVEARLELDGAPAESASVRAAWGDGSLNLILPLTPRRRGRTLVRAVWTRWRGPLGLVEVRRRCEREDAIDVTPDVRGIHEEVLRFFARDAVYGLKSQNLRGEGTEFDTLREFTPGMDSRFIDWKHSARHRKLLSKEFRQERNHQIVLGFDTGHLMLEPVDGVSRLDHAIRAGLLLGLVSLRGGDLVGGCGFDARFRHFLRPGRGMPHFARFQRFTAGLDYGVEETNFTLALAELNARLQRRALIVLFTEFVDTVSAELLAESLQWMVRRHVVVCVTLRDPLLTRLWEARPDTFDDVARAVIADDFLRERSIVLERIARLGVHCLEAPANGLSTALLNRYMLIKRKGWL